MAVVWDLKDGAFHIEHKSVEAGRAVRKKEVILIRGPVDANRTDLLKRKLAQVLHPKYGRIPEANLFEEAIAAAAILAHAGGFSGLA